MSRNRKITTPAAEMTMVATLEGISV